MGRRGWGKDFIVVLAVGAGFNLALACDLRVVGPTARFDSRFLRIGLHPGGGHLWMLERAVGPQAAAACVLFGEAIDAARAQEIGLAWSSHPAEGLLDAAVSLGSRAAAVPKPLAARTKTSLRAVPWQPDFEAAVATELDLWPALPGVWHDLGMADPGSRGQWRRQPR